jgi:allantoinase
MGTGYGSPEHFYETAKACVDRLRNDGDDLGRMMSIGLHPRITGNPARSDALARFIDYAQRLDGVVFMRRTTSREVSRNRCPSPEALATATVSGLMRPRRGRTCSVTPVTSGPPAGTDW